MAERKRIISEGDPAASQKRRAFGRKTRETINRRRTTKAETAERENVGVRASWAQLDKKIGVIDAEMEELTGRFSPDLPELEGAFISSELERLGTERAELQATRDSQTLKEGSIEVLGEREHTEVLGSIERDLEREVASEERLESFLDICRNENGKGWNNPRLNELGNVIDQIYLGAGTTEERILETFIHQPDALPPALRAEAEKAIGTLIQAEAEKMADATAFKEAGLRDRFRKAAIESFKSDPKKREEIVLAFFARTDRAPVLSLASPDAAMVAVREAVLAKGVLRSGGTNDGWGKNTVEFVMATLAAENKTFRADESASVQEFLALSGAIPKARMEELGIDERALQQLQSERRDFGPSAQRSKDAVERAVQEIAAAREKLDKVQEALKKADAREVTDWKARAQQEYDKAVESEANRLRADIVQREVRLTEISKTIGERRDVIATSKQRLELALEGLRDLTDFATEAARDLDGQVANAVSRVERAPNPSGHWQDRDMTMSSLLQMSASSAEQVVTNLPRPTMEYADREIARLKQSEETQIGYADGNLAEAAKAFPPKPYSDDGMVRHGIIQMRIEQRRNKLIGEKRPLREQMGGSYALEEMSRRASARVDEAIQPDKERLQQAVEALKAEVTVGQLAYREIQNLRITLRNEIQPIVKTALDRAKEEKQEHVNAEDAAKIEADSLKNALVVWNRQTKIDAAEAKQKAAKEKADEVQRDKIAWLDSRLEGMKNW